ncbi:MAG: alpha-glucosidase [Bifidobacteriaceae bacterium]|jgi:oligo-1,6-glucosidase|nr:alpha-glucosidase [Bifidobacteriaceae bacterium]
MPRLTLSSTIKEVYANPIGHDALSQLLRQVGIGEKMLTNPVVGNLRLRTVRFLARPVLPPEFFDALLTLLNTDAEDTYEAPSESSAAHEWWQEAVFYQIYPRSFKDSNGDGIGDLRGIIEKLDYLQKLGVTALWLSPIYDSPNDDNGYDIRDYRKILAEFGTMDDFDLLLREAHARGMRLIMDLVVNHTSDEHSWFREALANPSSKYRDYYFFRPLDRENPRPFNNWLSFFSGSAWKFFPGKSVQALHLFSKKQMDLNWDNPQVRHDVTAMVNWWLDKGIDGFRMDVINYISKREGLPDGDETIHSIMGYRGVEHYFYGPRLNEYLRELHAHAFAPHGAFSVGETPGIGARTGQLLAAHSRNELDMIFSFDQLETPGHTRFEDYRYDLNYLKRYLIDGQRTTADTRDDYWPSLFYENHDNPRMVSKVNPDPAVRAPLAKLLATLQLTMKGTPFIFQGQELGAVNQKFSSVDDFRDIESINLFHELVDGGESEKAAFAKVLAGSRDHARVPMVWNTEKNGGFADSEATPWILGDGDTGGWSAEEQTGESDSVLEYYRSLIALRRKHTDSLVYGKFHVVHEKKKNYFAYYRIARDEVFFVECNLSDRDLTAPAKTVSSLRCEFLMGNYPDAENGKGENPLKPYEARVYRILEK